MLKNSSVVAQNRSHCLVSSTDSGVRIQCVISVSYRTTPRMWGKMHYWLSRKLGPTLVYAKFNVNNQYPR